jgi:hypothetical protein
MSDDKIFARMARSGPIYGWAFRLRGPIKLPKGADVQGCAFLFGPNADHGRSLAPKEATFHANWLCGNSRTFAEICRKHKLIRAWRQPGCFYDDGKKLKFSKIDDKPNANAEASK